MQKSMSLKYEPSSEPQYGRALLMEVEEKEEREGGQDVLGGLPPTESGPLSHLGPSTCHAISGRGG